MILNGCATFRLNILLANIQYPTFFEFELVVFHLLQPCDTATQRLNLLQIYCDILY